MKSEGKSVVPDASFASGTPLHSARPCGQLLLSAPLEPVPVDEPPEVPVLSAAEPPPSPERRPSGSSIGGSPGRVSSVSVGHVPDELPPASDPSPNERDPPVPLPPDDPPPDSPPPVGDAPEAPVPLVAPDGVGALPVDAVSEAVLPPKSPPGVVPVPYAVPVVADGGGIPSSAAPEVPAEPVPAVEPEVRSSWRSARASKSRRRPSMAPCSLESKASTFGCTSL